MAAWDQQAKESYRNNLRAAFEKIKKGWGGV
jgi:hypothetical protein